MSSVFSLPAIRSSSAAGQPSARRRQDALAILLVWFAWLALSFLVAPDYGDRSVGERLFFSVYTVAVGAAVGFHLFDRLPKDGFLLFAARAASVLLFAVLLNEGVIEPLAFGLAPISRAGIYYALTDGLSIIVVFVLIRLGQRLGLREDLSAPVMAETSSNREQALTDGDADCFFVRVPGGTRRLRAADVLYIQAERDFSRIACIQGEHFVSESLKSLLAKAAGLGLVRIHKSFAVNLLHVDQLTRLSVRAGGRSLPVGRRHWPEVATAWRVRSSRAGRR